MVRASTLRSIPTKEVWLDDWVRLFNDRYPDPLGTGRGLTRFCHPSFGFSVLYAARQLQTAFVEVMVREHYDDTDEAVIREDELSAVRVAAIGTRAPLNLVDLTGYFMISSKLPSGVVGNTNQSSGRAFARDLHNTRPDVDGILYPSRLVHDEICVAVFDRAIGKLEARIGKTLNEDTRVPGILADLNMVRGIGP